MVAVSRFSTVVGRTLTTEQEAWRLMQTPVPPNSTSTMLRLLWAPMTNKGAPSVSAVLLISVCGSTHLQHGSDRDVHPPADGKEAVHFLCHSLVDAHLRGLPETAKLLWRQTQPHFERCEWIQRV
jgi:hypothetical protein